MKTTVSSANENRPIPELGEVRRIPSTSSAQFVALLNFELGFSPLDFERLGFYLVGLMYWGCLSFLALVVIDQRFGASEWRTPMMSAIWLLIVGILSTVGPVALPLLAARVLKSSEFQFTRAIDRRAQFRSQTAIVALVVFLPLFAGLAWSLVKPDLLLDSRAVDSAAFLKVFSGSYLQPGDPTNLIVPSGKITAACCQFWLGTVAFLLSTGLFHAGAALQAAKLTLLRSGIFILLFGFVGLAAVSQSFSHINFYYVFLMFLRPHLFVWLASLLPGAALVLLFCERRFCRLEML